MTAAFAYLLSRSAANRLRSQVLKLRSPRYLAAFAAGALYMWWFVFRPASRSPVGAGSAFGAGLSVLAPLLLVLVLGGVWVFGGDRSALAFLPAEVSFLLTAPVSRRGLILYKLARAQSAILVSSLIWVVLLRRGNSSLNAGLAAVSFWLLFTTIMMHRLAAALVRASAGEHGGAGFRRHWVAFGLFAAVAAAVVIQLIGARQTLVATEGPTEYLAALAGVISTGAARLALLPFRVMLAPTLAGSTSEWLRVVPGAMVVGALHAWWLLRSDAAFEEAAVEASAKRSAAIERMAARRSAMPVAPAASSGARTLPLSAGGWPAVAIVWKNTLCIMRTMKLRTLLGPIAIAFVAAFGFASRAGSPWGNVALVASVFVVALILFGGRTLRNDLRSDMLHLPFLKTLPLRGSQVVLAEIASGTVPMTLLQLAFVLVAEFALLLDPLAWPITADMRLGALLAAPFVVLALNVAMFTILNGTAVLFPAWMRLGAAGGAGVEVMGTNLLATTGTLVLLTILLLLPVLVSAASAALLRGHLVLTIASAGVTGGAMLIAECYALSMWLGRAFERAEPAQVT